MARYYPISPLFWCDSKVRSWGPEEKMLALYLLTCEHRNLEGLYRLPIPYIEADLGWENGDLTDHLARLEADGFLAYDEESQVILIRKALKYHQPQSEKQIQGAVNALQSVPDTRLWSEFVKAAEEYAPGLHDAIGNPSDTHSEGVDFGEDWA